MRFYKKQHGFTLPNFAKPTRLRVAEGKSGRRNLGGFTMVELMVVISIIMILSAIILPNYQVFHYQFVLLRSAHKLAQDIRMAQEMAASASELAGEVPPGYGIYLVEGPYQTTYILYADTYPANTGDAQYTPGQDTLIKSLELEKRVFIKEVSPSPMSINFAGPDPITTIYGGGASVTITLALEQDYTQEKKVFVNEAGLIYVKKQ